jgi:hypothetical protein
LIAALPLAFAMTVHAARFDSANLAQQLPIVVEVKSSDGKQ